MNLEEYVYVWPDQNNTFSAFRYMHGFVFPAENETKAKAEKMIQLVEILERHGIQPEPEDISSIKTP